MPVLPVPLFGGSAEEFWHASRRSHSNAAAREPGCRPVGSAASGNGSRAAARIGGEHGGTFWTASVRRCFVIMPFLQDLVGVQLVLEPAIRNAGDVPIRLDRAAVPGDVGRQINEGIKRCRTCVVADIDGLRANVLYELGLAHGSGKPTVLLNRVGTLGDAAVAPFDLTMHQRLEYQTIEASLVGRLAQAIAALPERRG